MSVVTDFSKTPAQSRPDSAAAADLSVIIPTMNEAQNVEPLVERLERTLEGIRWEVVFVDDDSTDGTSEILHDLARRDPRVRSIRRIGRRGLSSAVVEGIQSTSAPYIAVMDADLQHDETKLPEMLARLKADDCDLVIGSRYREGGGVGQWSGERQLIARIARRIGRIVTPADVSDPMSGFFMITRAAFNRSLRALSQQGYKILLDVLASASPPLKTAEIPYTFDVRRSGESKLDSLVVWEYLTLIFDKLTRGVIPARFFMFAAVGTVGIGVHMLVLRSSLGVFGTGFATSQFIATAVAMTSNFFLNNWLTYRDRRLAGWGLLRGLFTFYVICSLGVLANVSVANLVYRDQAIWWLAGGAGALISVVWNYTASSIFTWRRNS